MKTPFHLDDHPRRAHPLAPPPDGYFDRLPRHVMQRVQPAAPEAAPLWSWLTALSAPLRTALAAVLVLVAFVAVFGLLQRGSVSPAAAPVAFSGASAASAQALAAVPRADVVNYLLSDAAPRLYISDLAESALTDRDLTPSFLPGSDAELRALLDEQPLDDVYL